MNAPVAGRATTAVTTAMRDWLDHLRVERGVSGNTLSAYARDLDRYAAHLEAAGVTEPGQVAPQVVADFVALLRTGLVLSDGGGSLLPQLPLFLLGAGGRLTARDAVLSWITLDDMARADGGPQPRIELSTVLVERGSTAAPAQR